MQSEEIDLSVLAELKRERAGENVDEKVKKLVLVDFIVCLLLVFGHILSKQTSQLTGFVKY